jgi:glycosyltransferase involved in cell wall biosynthesis
MDGQDSPACFLSLVLPAYNEEAGIAHAIAEADAALAELRDRSESLASGAAPCGPYEIIVVDDGSRDHTAAVVQQALARHPRVRLLRHDGNRGYGAALRTGFEAARGRCIAFTDADCQFFLADLQPLLELCETHDVAVGWRTDRQDSRLRKFYSRGYNLLARTLLGTTVRDIDCALKVFRREALTRILPESRGFFVNTEMLTRARQQHLRVAETGVQHGVAPGHTADAQRPVAFLVVAGPLHRRFKPRDERSESRGCWPP